MDFYEDMTIELERYFRTLDPNFDAKRKYPYEISKYELRQYVRKNQIKFPLEQIDEIPQEVIIKKIQEIEENFKVQDAYDSNRKKKYVTRKLLERYINLQRKRLLPCRKREVHISDELQTKINSKIISEEICKVIKCIEQEFQNGIDVFPRLSKGSRKIGEKYDDTLLHEFSIYHFHLSNMKKDNAKSYERTDELLFVYIPILDNKNAYFLDVINEHTDNKVFEDIGLLNLIERNWPALLEPFTLRDIKNPSSLSISDNEQYQQLRHNCINSTITLENGKEVMKPGFGITISGRSPYVLLYTNRIMKEIALIERLCKKEIQENPNINFKLKLVNNIFEINMYPGEILRYQVIIFL